jgi:hypothetical protein
MNVEGWAPMTAISPPREHAYRAYLVRLWQEGPDDPWRALTRDAETHEERRFATVEQLFLFLYRQTEGAGSDGTGGTEL